MKIRSATPNNRTKAFVVRTSSDSYQLPYVKVEPRPTVGDPIVSVSVDKEIGREGFTYILRSGKEGTVHVDQILEYNQDPRYMRDLLLYKLTLEAQKRVDASPLSKREVIRRLGTSATQFYRLRSKRTIESRSISSSPCSTCSTAKSISWCARSVRPQTTPADNSVST